MKFNWNFIWLKILLYFLNNRYKYEMESESYILKFRWNSVKTWKLISMQILLLYLDNSCISWQSYKISLKFFWNLEILSNYYWNGFLKFHKFIKDMKIKWKLLLKEISLQHCNFIESSLKFNGIWNIYIFQRPEKTP